MNHTRIPWCDYTWNPITGCSPVSEGCWNCYASIMANRFWKGRKFSDVRFHPERIYEPHVVQKPATIFVCNMGDIFHPQVSKSMMEFILATIAVAHQHEFLLLTKRPERAARWAKDLRKISNVWIGISAENQDEYRARGTILLQMLLPHTFISFEPLLGAIDPVGIGKFDCAIVGGESGSHARPMHPDWARTIRDACIEADVPFFFKQWGTWTPCGYPYPPHDTHTKQFALVHPDGVCEISDDGDGARHLDGNEHCAAMARTGAKIGGYILDGKEWKQTPWESK